MSTATAPELALPSTDVEPDGLYEIVGQRVVDTPPMGAFEGVLASLLQRHLGNFAEDHRLGRVVMQVLFSLRPAVDCDRRPDVAFVSAERWPLSRRVPRTNSWAVVPDLAVEVVSPSNTMNEVVGKVDEYFRAGCRVVWVILPETRQVYIYESPTAVRIIGDDTALEGGALLPGFRVALADLFGAPETA